MFLDLLYPWDFLLSANFVQEFSRNLVALLCGKFCQNVKNVVKYQIIIKEPLVAHFIVK